MTNRMVREVGDALAMAAEDKQVRVLVLTGAGTSFCPGADLQAVAGGTIADEALTPSDFRAPVLLHQMPAVTIAAVNGACAGRRVRLGVRVRLPLRGGVGAIQHRVPGGGHRR